MSRAGFDAGPFRPQRFFGGAQFGEDRPSDRQQRRFRLNYILNADIFSFSVSARSAGLVMDQVQFSRISGAASVRVCNRPVVYAS
jgi:hypothetical protein